MSETVYVVFGETGEYSDRSDWPVKAYLSQQVAQELVVKATARANELFAYHYRDYKVSGVNEFDQNMRMDYTGTKYYICEVELER